MLEMVDEQISVRNWRPLRLRLSEKKPRAREGDSWQEAKDKILRKRTNAIRPLTGERGGGARFAGRKDS